MGIVYSIQETKKPIFLNLDLIFAISYLRLGQYKEAMQLFQKILKACKWLFDDEHPDTLKVMYNLAKSFTMFGLYQEAINLYTQTLKQISRDKYPNTLKSMTNLAISYSRFSQYLKAMSFNKQTLKMQKYILSDEYPYIVEFIDYFTIYFFYPG